MSNARPITVVIKELRKTAEELRLSHSVNGRWGDGEFEARCEYYRILNICSKAENEWQDVRKKEQRLSQYENMPEAANG